MHGKSHVQFEFMRNAEWSSLEHILRFYKLIVCGGGPLAETLKC